VQGQDARELTQTAWEQGTPIFMNDGSTRKVMTFDHPIGTTATGGHPVNTVEVHMSKKKDAHGVPSSKPQIDPEKVNPQRPQ
jgi:hypothetical protein